MTYLSSGSTDDSAGLLPYSTAQTDAFEHSQGSLSKRTGVDVVEVESRQDPSPESDSDVNIVPHIETYRMYPQRFLGLIGLVGDHQPSYDPIAD